RSSFQSYGFHAIEVAGDAAGGAGIDCAHAPGARERGVFHSGGGFYRYLCAGCAGRGIGEGGRAGRSSVYGGGFAGRDFFDCGGRAGALRFAA
ncbi:MAG: hypothetical protein WKF30_05730, partial [Pyrinomonadaceae bacterium]